MGHVIFKVIVQWHVSMQAWSGPCDTILLVLYTNYDVSNLGSVQNLSLGSKTAPPLQCWTGFWVVAQGP